MVWNTLWHVPHAIVLGGIRCSASLELTNGADILLGIDIGFTWTFAATRYWFALKLAADRYWSACYLRYSWFYHSKNAYSISRSWFARYIARSWLACSIARYQFACSLARSWFACSNSETWICWSPVIACLLHIGHVKFEVSLFNQSTTHFMWKLWPHPSTNS